MLLTRCAENGMLKVEAEGVSVKKPKHGVEEWKSTHKDSKLFKSSWTSKDVPLVLKLVPWMLIK